MKESTTITRSQLEEILDLKESAIRRDVDAATCATRSDWAAAAEAEDVLDTAIDKLFT